MKRRLPFNRAVLAWMGLSVAIILTSTAVDARLAGQGGASRAGLALAVALKVAAFYSVLTVARAIASDVLCPSPETLRAHPERLAEYIPSHLCAIYEVLGGEGCLAVAQALAKDGGLDEKLVAARLEAYVAGREGINACEDPSGSAVGLPDSGRQLDPGK